jgi:hypothetical protein
MHPLRKPFSFKSEVQSLGPGTTMNSISGEMWCDRLGNRFYIVDGPIPEARRYISSQEINIVINLISEKLSE